MRGGDAHKWRVDVLVGQAHRPHHGAIRRTYDALGGLPTPVLSGHSPGRAGGRCVGGRRAVARG